MEALDALSRVSQNLHRQVTANQVSTASGEPAYPADYVEGLLLLLAHLLDRVGAIEGKKPDEVLAQMLTPEGLKRMFEGFTRGD